MGSTPDPGESTPPSFDEFQRQTSLMTSCTLLWKELSDHFTSLEQTILKKSEALKRKLQTLDDETRDSMEEFERREATIEGSVKIALGKLEASQEAALMAVSGEGDGEIDDSEGLLARLRLFCLKMDSGGLWRFVAGKKKEIESLRAQMAAALSDCADPARFVLEAISEVFPADKRGGGGGGGGGDLGWACVLMLESLIPAVVDPVMGKSRLMVTPAVRRRAKAVAEAWKVSLEERGGIENVKTPDVHTFLQHLVTFGIVKKKDVDLYRKLVVGSAWRKQMPRLAVSLGLSDKMPDMIEELISKGQQLDAVHFTYEVGLVDKFPPVPLLKAFLRDAKKAATSILEDPSNTSRSSLAVRKEQSALRAVIRCIEEYKLESEFPPENLKKRLDQLEKGNNNRTEKRKPAAGPANKRTRANTNVGGPMMPPAKAGRCTNAYVSSFTPTPTYVRSSPPQYAVPAYHSPPPQQMYQPANSYVYSPEPQPLAGAYPGAPMAYPYGMAYQQAYYR